MKETGRRNIVLGKISAIGTIIGKTTESATGKITGKTTESATGKTAGKIIRKSAIEAAIKTTVKAARRVGIKEIAPYLVSGIVTCCAVLVGGGRCIQGLRCWKGLTRSSMRVITARCRSRRKRIRICCIGRSWGRIAVRSV